jgi:glycosyltransferase involved in cell wall biosynthesis
VSLIRRLPLPLRRKAIDALFAAASALRRPDWPAAHDADPTPGEVVVTGYLNDASGVGRAARMTADALEGAGLTVRRHDLRPAAKGALRGRAELPGPADGGVWLIHANAPEAEIALLAHRPRTWARRYRVTYWVWETPLAPANWVRVAPYFHEIWTPSRFAHDALAAQFRASGREDLTSRLRVIPHPAPEAVAPDRSRIPFPAGTAVALTLFDARSAAARKNPWGAVEAWTRAFPEPRPDRGLLLKAIGLDLDPPARARLDAIAASRPDVRVLTAEMTDAETGGLIAAADLLISLHRAEGFGLALAEAMAAGRTAVATAWSGNLDFMDATCAAMISARLVPVHDPVGAYRGSEWAEPDLDAAAAAIRRLLDDPAERDRLGRAARARIASLNDAWTPQALARFTVQPYRTTA